MNKNHLYAFYGSLRKGMYNYEHFKDGMEYIQTVEISGFQLFSLGSYPCVIRTDDSKDKLTIDLFTVTGAMEGRIHRMEVGAGYGYDEVEVNGRTFGIYTYDHSALSRLKERRVPGGDWVKHLRPEYAKTEQV